jgi:imidazolonepropionase-like amidohydrolase
MRDQSASSAGRSLYRATCGCRSTLAVNFNRRFTEALSRRNTLKGIAAGMAVAALSPASLAQSQPDERPILLRGARIFDGTRSKLIDGHDVLIERNVISALIPTGQTVENARVIDCTRKVVMPGLIDAHWHSIFAAVPASTALAPNIDVNYVYLLAAQEAERTLMRGFTTVRDVGGPSFALKRIVDEKRFAGPRIYPSGAMISQTSGHGDFRNPNEVSNPALCSLSAAEVAGVSAIADGVPEVLKKTREQLMLGASQIKIMAGGGVSSLFDPLDSLQYTLDEMRAAVNAASDWGTYVCAHVYTSAGIQRALSSGVKSIEHGQLADEDTVKKIVDAGAWWSIQPFLNDEDANPKATAEQRAMQKSIAEGTVRAFELGQKHKAKMAWGTDILFNPQGTRTQGRQLTKLSQWFDTADVLRLATSRNAELVALSGPRNPYPGKLGVIEAGALADILVVDGDPLAQIDLLADPESHIQLIMKDGHIYKNSLSV